ILNVGNQNELIVQLGIANLNGNGNVITARAEGNAIRNNGDLDREVSVAKTFYEQTHDELTKNEVKQIEYDDQAIRIILMLLLEDIYAIVESCETAQEIWLHV
nr:hypothetical protein [Tanacetum cinerariifolium]